MSKSESGTFYILQDDFAYAAKHIFLPDGTTDVVTRGGETSFGRFSDLVVLTQHRVMAAIGRAVEAGLSRGWYTAIPAQRLASAMKHATTLEGFYTDRLAGKWLNDKARAEHEVLLESVRQIIAAEQAAN